MQEESSLSHLSTTRPVKMVKETVFQAKEQLKTRKNLKAGTIRTQPYQVGAETWDWKQWSGGGFPTPNALSLSLPLALDAQLDAVSAVCNGCGFHSRHQ